MYKKCISAVLCRCFKAICRWPEFNVSVLASISVVCFTEREREPGNEVGRGGMGL